MKEIPELLIVDKAIKEYRSRVSKYKDDDFIKGVLQGLLMAQKELVVYYEKKKRKEANGHY